jgi:hypothetical protein
MKNTIIVLSIMTVLLSSCSNSLYVTSGAKSNEPLIFRDEYVIKDLPEITESGSAFWGIPTGLKGNNDKHKSGLIFTFNGVQLFRTPKILPILTLISYTAITQPIFAYSFDMNNSLSGLVGSYILALPIAGTLNNWTWGNSALSSAGQAFNYRLIKENPNVDVFMYPKYVVKRENIFSNGSVRLKYLWYQDASINGRVLGASLKRTEENK